MISFEIFMVGLLVISTITGLATEAVKSILVEYNMGYRANTLAGLVALVISTAIGLGYICVAEIPFSSQIMVYLIAEVVMSWLCAMVGYDKVIQTISQFKTIERKD